MFDRIRRSIVLLRAAIEVLHQDRRRLWFPVMSASATLLVVAAFLLPVSGLRSIDGLGNGGKNLGHAFAFLFYIVQYFAITYFNAALVGGTPTLSDGLRMANRRVGTLRGHAVVSATVGMVPRMIQERVGFVGRLVAGPIGAGWAVATCPAVPLIVAGGHDTFGAIAGSASTARRTWGENLAGQAGLGVLFGLIYPALFGAAALVVLALLLVAVLQSTLAGILSAVLYRYALDGGGFPAQGLNPSACGRLWPHSGPRSPRAGSCSSR